MAPLIFLAARMISQNPMMVRTLSVGSSPWKKTFIRPKIFSPAHRGICRDILQYIEERESQ
jgi:hypothetical protein